ncbi:MAG: hypothetical protein FIA91_11490 [Geobacter sp.]|nr:hypothetical protein [Geobacter sp.]
MGNRIREFKIMRLTSLFFTLLLLIMLAGCTTLPVDGSLPYGLTAQQITTVESGAAFAVSPDGAVAAVFSSGLQLVHIPTKERHQIGDEKPDALAWSPLGYSLAALYHTQGKSRIVIHDQLGMKMAEQTVNDEITDICWLSEQEIAAGGFRVKNYKFGTNFKSILYRWQPGINLPVVTELKDSTLRPASFLKWQSLLAKGPRLSASMASGHIAYLHPIDPPLFATYYKITIRDLATGVEIDTVNAGLSTSGAKFSADGELLLYGDGNGSVLLLNPWSEEQLKTTATPGKSLALSPDGATWFADGAVFTGDRPPALLATNGQAAFTHDSSRLLISSGSTLYQVSGIKPAAGSLFVPEVGEKVAKLRSMRLQGLISAADYKSSMKRILNP